MSDMATIATATSGTSAIVTNRAAIGMPGSPRDQTSARLRMMCSSIRQIPR
jgi:hypothetical protein